MSAAKDKGEGSTLDAAVKTPTLVLMQLSEEPLLPVKIRPAVPCHSAQRAWLFSATNLTQRFLSGSREGGVLFFFFLDPNVGPEVRQTWEITSCDVRSITTYWEASECCCWCRRCFPYRTCLRCFLPTSPFCPCGWSSDGGASDAGSSWARARRCKRCGALQESKTAHEPTDIAHAGKLDWPAQRTPSNSGWCAGTSTHKLEERGISVLHLQKIYRLRTNVHSAHSNQFEINENDQKHSVLWGCCNNFQFIYTAPVTIKIVSRCFTETRGQTQQW